MKIQNLCLISAAVAGSYALGYFTPSWLAQAKNPSTATPTIARVTTPLISGSTLISEPDQAKQDVRKLKENPRPFLDSLKDLSPLKKQARILSALNEMNLDEIKKLTESLEGGLYYNDEHSEAMLLAMQQWAELDHKDLMKTSLENTAQATFRYYGLGEALSKWAETEPEAAWEKAKEESRRNGFVKDQVLRKIAKNNPEFAINLLNKEPINRGHEYIYSNIFNSWAMRDLDAAIKAYEKIPLNESTANVIGTLGSAYAYQKPDEAYSWARSLKKSHEREKVVYQIIGVISSKDPLKAKALVESPDFFGKTRTAMSTIISDWATRDFDQAFQFAKSTTSNSDKQSYLQAITDQANKKQIKTLLEKADEFSPTIQKSIYQSGMSSWWGDDNNHKEVLEKVKAPGMKEDLIKSQLNSGNYYYGSVTQQKELFDLLQPTSQTTQMAETIARRMSWDDPNEALKWADSLKSEDLKMAAKATAIGRLAANEPKTAAAKLSGIPAGEARTKMLRNVAENWVDREPKEAVAWAQGLEGKDQSAAMSSIVQFQIGKDNAESQKLFDQWTKKLTADEQKSSEFKNVATNLAKDLAENNPQEAVQWLQKVPTGPMQDEAMAGVVEKWASYDAIKASEWIGSLPGGDGRDLAADKLVHTIARDDPQSAWQWALSIQDRGKRRSASARVLEAWKAYGQKDVAKAALQAGGFNADELKELEQKIN